MLYHLSNSSYILWEWIKRFTRLNNKLKSMYMGITISIFARTTQL